MLYPFFLLQEGFIVKSNIFSRGMGKEGIRREQSTQIVNLEGGGGETL